MRTKEWIISYFEVEKPRLSEWPHIIFKPDLKYFETIFEIIGGCPGIWGVPIPFHINGCPTSSGVDQWALVVKNEEDIKKLKAQNPGWFIPVYEKDYKRALCPTEDDTLPFNAWSFEANQNALIPIWNLRNVEYDKLMLDCNSDISRIEPKIERFFTIDGDVTKYIDNLIEVVEWFIFSIGPDDEYSVLVTKKVNKDCITKIIDRFKKKNLTYVIIDEKLDRRIRY
jgi:hypothetical protein